MKKIFFIFCSLLVLFLSSKYYYQKWFGHELIPNHDILDERDYAFVGYTFRKTGIPTGWTTLGAYKTVSQRNHQYPVISVVDVNVGKGKETIILVKPFFDQPLFGSFLYSLGIQNNPQTFDAVNPSDYRSMAINISVVTGILLFIASFIIYRNFFISLFSLVIYSTVPSFIFFSRFALLENILIPLSLLNLIFISSRRKIFLIIAGLIAGLALITKIQGIYILLFSLIYLVNQKYHKKDILLLLAGFSVFPIIYYSYCLYLSPELLINVYLNQSGRGFFGSLNFLVSIIQPKFHQFPIDGYWLWGLISFVILSVQKSSQFIPIKLGFLSYLLVYLFFGSADYPWYVLPFLPYLIISSAKFLYDQFTSPKLSSLLILLVLPISTSLFWGHTIINPQENGLLVYRLVILTIVVGFLIKRYFKNIFWIIFMMTIIIIINKFNHQAFLYITSNWNHLPEQFSIK